MNYNTNTEELLLAKEFLFNNSYKLSHTDFNSKFSNWKYLECLWLVECCKYDRNLLTPYKYNIKNIVIDDYEQNLLEFKEEICFIMDNLKIGSSVNTATKGWGYTIYIYTESKLFYSSGIPNKDGTYFNNIPIF